MNILEEYPPQVHNPATGSYCLVRWYEHDEGNHVILANSEQEALMLWKCVLEKHPEAQVEEFVHAVLVDCPEPIAKKWAHARYNHELSNFSRHLIGLAETVTDACDVVPEHFEKCSHREDSYSKYSCKKCHSFGIKLKTSAKCLFEMPTVRNVYHKFRKNDRSNLRSAVGSSQVPRNLNVALLQSGHHRPGVSFVPYENVRSLGSDGFEQVLFFFTGSSQPVPPAFVEAMEFKQKQKEAHRLQQEVEWKKRKKEYARLAGQELTAIMEAAKQCSHDNTLSP